MLGPNPLTPLGAALFRAEQLRDHLALVAKRKNATDADYHRRTMAEYICKDLEKVLNEMEAVVNEELAMLRKQLAAKRKIIEL